MSSVAGLGFVLPILLSILCCPDLFSSWLLAITGGIPGQHSVQLEETNPSPLLVAQGIVDHVGLPDSKAIVFAIYGLAVIARVLAPLGWSLLDTIRNGKESFSARLDSRLIMLWAKPAPSVFVVRAAGVEPAQRLRTEGF